MRNGPLVFVQCVSSCCVAFKSCFQRVKMWPTNISYMSVINHKWLRKWWITINSLISAKDIKTSNERMPQSYSTSLDKESKRSGEWEIGAWETVIGWMGTICISITHCIWLTMLCPTYMWCPTPTRSVKWLLQCRHIRGSGHRCRAGAIASKQLMHIC